MVKATITLPIYLATVAAAIQAVLTGRPQATRLIVVGKTEDVLVSLVGCQNIEIHEISGEDLATFTGAYAGVEKVLTVERSGARYRVFDGEANVAEENELRYLSFPSFGGFVDDLSRSALPSLGEDIAIVLDQIGGTLTLYPLEDFIDLSASEPLMECDRPVAEGGSFFE